MTMIPKNILKQILDGRTCILTKSGKLWSIYKRPEHLCFSGEIVYEVASPNNTEFTIIIGKFDKRPLIIKT